MYYKRSHKRCRKVEQSIVEEVKENNVMEENNSNLDENVNIGNEDEDKESGGASDDERNDELDLVSSGSEEEDA